jgi:hypothetical protein
MIECWFNGNDLYASVKLIQGVAHSMSRLDFMTTQCLSWQDLESLTDFTIDRVNGPTNAQSKLRFLGSQKPISE